MISTPNYTAGTVGGTSATRWRRGHNRHHAMPQRLNHDIDLSTVPLLAYNRKVVKNNAEGKGFLIKHQTYFFPLVSPLLGGLCWRWYKVPKFPIKNRLYTGLFCRNSEEKHFPMKKQKNYWKIFCYFHWKLFFIQITAVLALIAHYVIYLSAVIWIKNNFQWK